MELAGFTTASCLAFEEGDLVVGGVKFLAQVLILLFQLQELLAFHHFRLATHSVEGVDVLVA
jgi:hypothetical protein